MNKVHLLMLGEYGQGGNVLGIYSSMDKAKEAAKNVPDAFGEGWKQIDETKWEASCDWLEIIEYMVE